MRRSLLLALLLAPITAHATILADWDLAELVKRSDRIVIGTIASKRTVVTTHGLFTETLVHVEETLHGTHEPSLVVAQIGGTFNGRTTWVEGDARLLPREKMLLFTYAHQDGRRYLVGMALGAFFVHGDVLTQQLVESARTRSLTELRTIIKEGGR